MPTQLNQNTSDLQSILDAVNALPEAISVSGEISITENGVHDVKQYATANVNVQSAPVLLWTNASPTSAFAAQTISVSGSGYSGYLIEVRFSTSDTNKCVALIPVGGKGAIGAISSSGVAPYATRAVLGTSASSVNFGGAALGGGGSTANAIPTRIWGVKFTL